MLHRDLKPSNILIAQDGTPILSDFGLALMMTSTQTRLTSSGTILGTPEYMSPEQCEGETLTAAADIYSLGVVAYEMLTGRVPFSAATPAAVLIAQIQNKLPPPRDVNPDLSPSVESALLKALAKAPSDRFRTAGDFVRALTADTAPEAVARVAVVPATGARMRPARVAGGFLLRRLIPLAMAIIVLVVAGGGTFLLYQTLSPAVKRTAGGASPKPSNVTTPSPSPSPLVKGPLVFEAKLDGSGGDLFPTFYVGDPGALKLSFTQGAIEIAAIRRANASTGGGVNYRNLARYATEVDFSVQPGTDMTLVWVVRSADPTHGNLQVEVNAAAESMHLAYFEPSLQPTPTVLPESALSTEYHIAGLQTGRTFTLSALVDPPRYVIYLDGIQVFAVSDARGAAVGVPAISGYGTGGVLRVTGIRIYTLP